MVSSQKAGTWFFLRASLAANPPESTWRSGSQKWSVKKLTTILAG